ncbi:hypothetical protein SprV_0602186600 [Sparganum proliferum]
MMPHVTENGAISDAFAVISGVKQDCIIAPSLFGLMFSVMLVDVYRGERIDYRTDGHLLNSRRMQVRTRLSATTIHDLLFAYDCALNTTIEVDMQRSMDLLAAGFTHFGPTINKDKTVVRHQPSPNTQHSTTTRINVDGNQLKTVVNIAYLGSALSPTQESTTKWYVGSPKTVTHSAICKTQCGIATAFNWRPNRKCTRPSS